MSEASLRFRRGARSIVEFYNLHAAEPIDRQQAYKMIARGTIQAGKDGSKIIAEEGQILHALRRAAGSTTE
jgi:hypothetical protein